MRRGDLRLGRTGAQVRATGAFFFLGTSEEKVGTVRVAARRIFKISLYRRCSTRRQRKNLLNLHKLYTPNGVTGCECGDAPRRIAGGDRRARDTTHDATDTTHTHATLRDRRRLIRAALEYSSSSASV